MTNLSTYYIDSFSENIATHADTVVKSRTLPKGVWKVSYNTQIAANQTGYRQAYINASSNASCVVEANTYTYATLGAEVVFNVASTLSVSTHIIQNSGATLTANGYVIYERIS